ncbi:molybdenum cofactor guanylyltransferase [Methanocaldococcus fervens]|uniref:molybdenum cofactor guanylyltransferase n=1 Tax=Methanocaldococcus fervens TaxID=83171 RepID=UPI00064F39E4|nr:molybdenum cofactor guanylyltransferase [Methanocaldococcus fervens]
MIHIIGGIILSGGKGKRIGGKKPFRIFNGKYLIEYPSDVLKSLNIPFVTVFAKNSIDLFKEKEYLIKYKCIISFDLIEDKGPLMGILCGMRALNTKWFVVLPCDCPYISIEALKNLISKIDTAEKNNNLCIIPKHENGYIEPLFALYKRDSLHILNNIIMEDKNLSIRYFISHLNPLYVKAEELDETKRIFKNINTIEELKNVE